MIFDNNKGSSCLGSIYFCFVPEENCVLKTN